MQEKIKIMLEQYSSLQDLYFQYLNLVENKIKIILEENDILYQALHRRVKSYGSLSAKLNNSGIHENLNNDIKNVSDIAGVRIVFYERDSMEKFTEFINNHFEIIEWKNNLKIADGTKKNIEYRAEHYVLRLKEDNLLKYKGFRFELQLVTLLSHAGNELGHNFFYKNENELKEKNSVIFEEMQEQYYSAWRDLMSAESKFNIIRKQAEEITVGNQIIIKIVSKQYIKYISKIESYLVFGHIIEELKSAAPFLSNNSIILIKENKLLENLLQKLYELKIRRNENNYDNDILENYSYAFSQTLDFLEIYIYVYADRLTEIILKLNEIVELENGLDEAYGKFLKRILNQDKYKKKYIINNFVYEWLISLNDNEKYKYIKEILILSEEFLNLEVSGANWSSTKTIAINHSVLLPSNKIIENRGKILDLLLELLINMNSNKKIINVIFSDIHNSHYSTNSQLESIISNDTEQIFSFIIKYYEEIDIFYKFQILSCWNSFLQKSENKKVKQFNKLISKDQFLNLYNNIFAWYIDKTLDFDEDRKKRQKILTNYAEKTDEKDLNFIVKLYESYSKYNYSNFESSYYMNLMYQIGAIHPELGKKINDDIYKKYSNYCPYLISGILSNKNQEYYSNQIKTKIKSNKAIQMVILDCIYNCNYSDKYNLFSYITKLKNLDLDIKSEIAKIILKLQSQEDKYINLLFNIIKEANEKSYYINFPIIINVEEYIKQILTKDRINDILYNLNLSKNINMINGYLLKIIFEIDPESIRKIFEKRLLSKNGNRLQYSDEYYYLTKAENLDKEFNNNLNWVMRIIGKNELNIYHISEVSKLMLGKNNSKIEQILLKKVERKNCCIKQCLSIIWFLKIFDDSFSSPILLKKIIKKYGKDDNIKNQIECLLFDTGVVSGEYGLADAFKQKAKMLKDWQYDADETVKNFAKENIAFFNSCSRKEIEKVILRNFEEEEKFKIKNH